MLKISGCLRRISGFDATEFRCIDCDRSSLSVLGRARGIPNRRILVIARCRGKGPMTTDNGRSASMAGTALHAPFRPLTRAAPVAAGGWRIALTSRPAGCRAEYGRLAFDGWMFHREPALPSGLLSAGAHRRRWPGFRARRVRGAHVFTALSKSCDAVIGNLDSVCQTIWVTYYWAI